MLNLVAFVDGGSLGNPGPSGIGVVIEGSERGTIRIAKWIGHQDNNVAEYVALLEALQCALSLSPSFAIAEAFPKNCALRRVNYFAVNVESEKARRGADLPSFNNGVLAWWR